MLTWTKPFAFGSSYVPIITSYVAYHLHSDVFLLSMKILNILTKLPAFRGLAVLLKQLRLGLDIALLTSYRLVASNPHCKL